MQEQAQKSLQAKKLAEHLEKAHRELQDAARSAAKEVRCGEDNPAIRRVSSQSFTMISRNLGTANWSPFFHDWKAQYARLGELIDGQKFSAIAQIIKSGKLRDGVSTEVFAPTVVEHLKAIVGDLPEIMSEYVKDGALRVLSTSKMKP